MNLDHQKPMKIKLNKTASDRRQSGSAMLVALMIMGVVTMGVAAWVSIVNGRTSYTESLEDSMRRRVALENSRSITEEYLYNVAALSSGAPAASFPLDPSATPNPNPPFNANQPDIVEQVAIAASGSGPLQETSVAPTGRVNRLGFADSNDCYHTFYNALLGRGSVQTTRRFELRSRSPILYGDLVILNTPTITPGDFRFKGNINVKGRTVIWRPDLITQDTDSLFTSDDYVLMTDNYGAYPIFNSNGDQVRPSNFPATPITSGAIAADANGYDGRLSTVHNEYDTINSLHGRLGSNPINASGLVTSFERGVSSNGSGSISINLLDPALSRVFIENDTQTIVLNGQSTDTDFDYAGTLQPVLIVINQDALTQRNLDTIELTHRNNRRLIVGVKKVLTVGGSDSDLRVVYRWMNTATATNPGTTWRLITIAENVEVRFRHYATDSDVTIYGGVRTDGGFHSHNGITRTFTIERERDPAGLATLLDRNVWLESYVPD